MKMNLINLKADLIGKKVNCDVTINDDADLELVIKVLLSTVNGIFEKNDLNFHCEIKENTDETTE
jgi:hypothetical protein